MTRVRALLSRGSWWIALEVALAGIAIWSHIRMLATLPQGFYKDELSIAYNAYLIATTGYDEFGVSFPMYTHSFGDYKNAGYVYLSVIVMRIFGLSSWTVRLPSVLCWLAGSWFMYSLGRTLWPRAQSRVFLLLQLAFTPSLFCLSRIAFEVIGLYPALALFLLAVHRGFEWKSPAWAALAGVAIGASTYMYSTFRLLAPLHCLLVFVCYCTRQHVRQLSCFAAAAACTVSPFAWYLYAHGDNLTARYREIGYAHLALPFAEKFDMFVERYVGYFSRAYLLQHGDENLRHHTGFGGELFLPTLVAALLAIASIVLVRRFRRVRFHWLLLGGLIVSPIAASLTRDPYHSLQAFSLVVFAILLAQYGFHHVLRQGPRAVPLLVIAAGVLNAGSFVEHYYGPYRTTSIAAFEFYGVREAIVKAVRERASRVVIDSRRRGRHAELYANFYNVVLSKRRRDKLPPLQPGRPGDVQPGEYFIFEDRKNSYPDLRAGLPEGALYVAAPYGPITQQLARRSKR